MTAIRWCMKHDQGYWAVKHDFSAGECVIVVMPSELAKKGRVKLVKRLWALRQFAAVTYPPFGVYIRQSWWDEASQDRKERLLWHEGVHWRQYVESGPLVYIKYVALWLRYGYKKHPYEIEAYTEAKEFRP